MNLEDTDEVVAMQLDNQGEYLLTVSEFGYGKLTPISEFGVQHRGGKGVRCYKIVEKSGNLVGAKVLNRESGEIIMMTNTGTTIRLSVADISVIGRNTTGVKLISIEANKDVFVASFARVKETENDADVDMEHISPEEILESEKKEIEAAEEDLAEIVNSEEDNPDKDAEDSDEDPDSNGDSGDGTESDDEQ